MRGDFSSKTNNGTSVDSHMIKNGSLVYAWSGTRGAKFDISSFMATSSTGGASTKTSVNLDEQINYSCNNWTKDTSKFTVPTDINFIDISGMLSGAIKNKVRISQ